MKGCESYWATKSYQCTVLRAVAGKKCECTTVSPPGVNALLSPSPGMNAPESVSFSPNMCECTTVFLSPDLNTPIVFLSPGLGDGF